nr:MAG TPA: hypothetical protein [Caudoviricetes sp.]
MICKITHFSFSANFSQTNFSLDELINPKSV